MNKTNARRIAETITNEEILEMFNIAKSSIKDWTKISSVNKGITKGTAWNILAKDFDINTTYHILAKTNMVREFGEYLPSNLKLSKKQKLFTDDPVHQEPKF